MRFTDELSSENSASAIALDSRFHPLQKRPLCLVTHKQNTVHLKLINILKVHQKRNFDSKSQRSKLMRPVGKSCIYFLLLLNFLLFLIRYTFSNTEGKRSKFRAFYWVKLRGPGCILQFSLILRKVLKLGHGNEHEIYWKVNSTGKPTRS